MNIEAVSRLTGVSASTLRKWEERYGAPCPGRTDRNHRQYSEADVQTVLWLKGRLEEGYRIREAALLLRDRDGEGQRGGGLATAARGDADGRLDLQDRSRIERRIVGWLRKAIDAHGPVTNENISSAAKRVYSALEAVARQQRR